MKKLFLATLLIQAGVFLSAGAPAPIFINNSPLTTPPQVDATIFWNRSTIDIFTQFPYQAQNVQFWTNNGIMNATPGFLIEYDLDGKRGRNTRANSRNLQRPATMFFNDGNISAGSSSAFVSTFTAGSVISINAKNVMNSGRLDGTESGLIKILATNGMADLARGEFRVGPSTVPVCDFLPFPGETNFFPNAGITDLYWGAGVNNALGTNGQRLNLNTVSNFLSLPFPQTPSHEVRVRGSTFTNVVSLPGGFFGFGGCSGAYDVFVHTNDMGLFSLNSTTMLVNIVFVPTNSLLQSSNLAVDVRFASSFDRDNNLVYAPVVQFRSSDFDIVEQQSVDSYVTFMDNSAAETNIVIARPFLTGTAGTVSPGRRPNSYNIVKGRFCNFDFSEAANSVYDPTLFFRPENGTNVVDTIYAGYSAEVGQSNAQSIAASLPIITGTGLSLITGLGVNPALSDPTNFSGRVEITADRLNLGQARIRAENFVSIRANDLTSNQFAQVDAPFIDFQVKSTNSELVIDNLAPASVNRLSGSISAWSSVWNVPVTNVTVVGTNTNAVVHIVRFHVLLLDSCLQSVTPVTLNRFSVSAPSLIIRDNILINGAVSLDTKALSVDPNATLALPVGRDLAFTNLHNLLNFTNDGTVSVQGGMYLGTFDSGHVVPPPKKKKKKKTPPPPTPLDHFVNRGALAAATLFVRATNAEISSSGINPARIGSASGVISFVGSTLVISNANVTAGSDMELHANDLLTAQSFLSAGRVVTNFVFTNVILRPVRGGILIDATNSFGDFGPATSNLWRVTGGISVSRRPANAGDLMGTHVNVAGGSFKESPIVWAGEDRGVVAGGYTNNLALGRLTLDGAVGNLFHFSSSGGSRAIYIDYLELLNSATNYNFALGVDSNFTIYFADANIPPEKLDSTGGGRIRWVRDFTGPQSSTRITYPNGVTYTFNSGLVRSKDLDSDGDGIVNADDCTPIIPPGEESNPGLWFGANCPAAPLAAAKSVSTDAVGLTITLGLNGREALLNWNAAANSASAVEFKDSIVGGTWQSLTNFINGPAETRVTVKDAVDAPLRVYRVRVEAAKP